MGNLALTRTWEKYTQPDGEISSKKNKKCVELPQVWKYSSQHVQNQSGSLWSEFTLNPASQMEDRSGRLILSIDLPIEEVERASSKKEQERQSENIQNCKIKEHIFFFWRSYYVKYFSSQIALKIGSLGRTQGTLKITSEIMTARNQARIRNKLFARKMSRISSNEPRAI